MEHDHWFELVSAAADDQLDAAERVRLDDHLRDCSACREDLARFESDRRRRMVAPPVDHPGLAERIHRARADDLLGAVRWSRPGRILARRAAVVGLGAAACVAALMALSGPAEPPPPSEVAAGGDVVVDARAQSFDRADVEVEPGATVEWRNTGATRHQLIRRLGPVTITEDLPPGSSEEAEFTRPGTYRFSCAIHPEMEGTVTVEA